MNVEISRRLKGFDYGVENQGYFVTLRFINFLRMELLQTLHGQFLQIFKDMPFECDALVTMPDHVHFVCHATENGGTVLSDLVCVLKSKSVHEFKRLQLVTQSFWQKGYYEHVLRNEQDLAEKIRYTIGNPIKAGLVESEDEYECLYVRSFEDGATQGRPLRGKNKRMVL